MAASLADGVGNTYGEMVAHRRWLHAHPELSFQEVATAAYVAAALGTYAGVSDIVTGVGRTGVVALVRGRAGPGPCIALRADMDALPLPETADVPYASTAPGVMHACGHDGHMSSLLAAARVLGSSIDRLAGTVKLVFQPAEEGYGGAAAMIADGVLSGVAADGTPRPDLGPPVDEIYGIHLWTYEPAGAVCVKDGPLMAASNRFEIEVEGRGGHGAHPHGTVDAVVAAAALVGALQTVVSRNADPVDPAVITCGSIAGGHGYNIICDHVRLRGTTRCFTPATGALIEDRMRDVCSGIAATYGGDVKLAYDYGYPATVNAYPACVERVRAAARAVAGDAHLRVAVPTCGAEDFSYFLLAAPGAFFFVGAALPGVERPHHKSVFDFDEAAMLVSASMYVRLATDALAPRA